MIMNNIIRPSPTSAAFRLACSDSPPRNESTVLSRINSSDTGKLPDSSWIDSVRTRSKVKSGPSMNPDPLMIG